MSSRVKSPEQVVQAVVKRWRRHVIPAWGRGLYEPNQDQIEEMALEAINTWREQQGIEVQLWRAAHDNVRVVQIDTSSPGGRLRINLNDAPIWDGDPATDERPGAHFHDVWN